MPRIGKATAMKIASLVFFVVTIPMLQACGGAANTDAGKPKAGLRKAPVAAVAGVANFSGLSANYGISASATGYTVTDLAGAEGTSTLTGATLKLNFADVALALGGASGNAGQAYRLYKAAFNRSPDLAGLGVQINALDLGASLQQISENFINSAEFKSLYGANPTDGTLVTLLYRNVLGREPEPAGYDHWLGVLGRGELSRAQALYYFSESAENQANVAALIQNGIAFIPVTGGAATDTVTVSPASSIINAGTTVQLTAAIKDGAGTTLSGRSAGWSSSNTAVATVSASGLVTALAAGTATITASSEGKTGGAALTVANAGASSVVVDVDAAQSGGAMRDLLGANKKPTAADRGSTATWNAASLYSAFGISQVRLHDSDADLCSTYTAAVKQNTGVSPAQNVSGCVLEGGTAPPHFTWTPSSSADADLNNPDNYDFTAVDEAVSAALAAGAGVYLRLGESYNGPNDTNDPVAWAKVAANIYKHVIGVFKPTPGIAVDPVYVEIHNEPDGGFWRGQKSTFNTLFVETAQRVRAAAAAAGKTVKVGGAGFTKSILTTSTIASNPANGFITNVGASTIDFYSAHLYNNCSSATLSSAATFLRSLRALVNSQGGTDKPLHITEWNIGLGNQCGNAFYAEQRTQSFDSGVLTLMQDPAQNVEAAHFYAGMPIMALFDFSSASGAVRINPSAWAFWAHGKLRGGTAIGAQVCPQGGSCVAGYAADSAPLLALAGQTNGGPKIVITNDGGTPVTYNLKLSGLSGTAATVTIGTPPSGVRDVLAAGNPVTADAAALASLFASVSQDKRSELGLNNGRIELMATIPARTVQVVEIRTR